MKKRGERGMKKNIGCRGRQKITRTRVKKNGGKGAGGSLKKRGEDLQRGRKMELWSGMTSRMTSKKKNCFLRGREN